MIVNYLFEKDFLINKLSIVKIKIQFRTDFSFVIRQITRFCISYQR